MKGSDTNVELNYRDNGYLPEKELFRNIEILFASLDQIVRNIFKYGLLLIDFLF